MQLLALLLAMMSLDILRRSGEAMPAFQRRANWIGTVWSSSVSMTGMTGAIQATSM